MNVKANEEFNQFKSDLVRFIKSELAGDGTVVTKNGRLWLRFPVALAAHLYPGKTSRQIRHALECLVDEGVLMESKIDKNKFDQASWYALVDQPGNLV